MIELKKNACIWRSQLPRGPQFTYIFEIGMFNQWVSFKTPQITAIVSKREER